MTTPVLNWCFSAEATAERTRAGIHTRNCSSATPSVTFVSSLIHDLRLPPSRLISFYKRTIAQSLSGSYDPEHAVAAR
jgi:hypothetical protein